jgi:hypothetical protein
MTTQNQNGTRAELLLGPADGEEATVPLRPDGLPIRIHRVSVNGQDVKYLRRHQARGRDWVYVYEPDAK